MTQNLFTIKQETDREPVYLVRYGDPAGEACELGFVFETPCGLWGYATEGAQRHYNHRAGISKDEAAKRLARRFGLDVNEWTQVTGE